MDCNLGSTLIQQFITQSAFCFHIYSILLSLPLPQGNAAPIHCRISKLHLVHPDLHQAAHSSFVQCKGFWGGFTWFHTSSVLLYWILEISQRFIHSLIHSFIHQRWKWSKFLGYSTSDPKNSYCAAQKQAHGSGKFIYWLYTKIGPENTFMLIKSLFLFFIFVALIWSYHGFVHLETSFSLPLESNGWSLFPIYVMWTSLEGKKNSTRWKDATSAPWKLEE